MFSGFGKVSFVAYTKVSDFAVHLKDGRLMGSVCSSCGHTSFPPRADCPECLSGDFEFSEVSGRGMGMDIVLATIKSLRGSVELDSVVGEGSCFTIQLPPSSSVASLPGGGAARSARSSAASRSRPPPSSASPISADSPGIRR